MIRKFTISGPAVSYIDGKTDTLFKVAKAVQDIEKIAEDSLRTKPLDPGYNRVIINALGAGEYYGFNSRGDYFPENHLNPNPPKWGMKYGYKTYETEGAVYLQHKRNRDFQLGKVAMAIWHEPSKRVFVLADLNKVAAGPFIEQLRTGEHVPTSMGTAVAFDACSICAPEKAYLDSVHPKELEKKAKAGIIRGIRFKPSDTACEHIPHLAASYIPEANDYAYMINFYPVFHDISIVDVPADELSAALKKVASALDSDLFNSNELHYLADRKYIDHYSTLVRKRLIPNSISANDISIINKIAHSVGKKNLLKIAAHLKLPLTYTEWKLLNSPSIYKVASIDDPLYALSLVYLKRSAEPHTLEIRLRKYGSGKILKYNKAAHNDKGYMAYMYSILKNPDIDFANMPSGIRKIATKVVEVPKTINDYSKLRVLSKFYTALFYGVENV